MPFSASLDNSTLWNTMEYHRNTICHVSRYFLASDLMNLMMSHPRRHDIDAKQRLENEFVHVSLLQRS